MSCAAEAIQRVNKVMLTMMFDILMRVVVPDARCQFLLLFPDKTQVIRRLFRSKKSLGY